MVRVRQRNRGPMPAVTVARISEVDDRLYRELTVLLDQLSPGAHLPSREQIAASVGSDTTALFAATAGGRTVGVVIAVVGSSLMSRFVLLEDLVVDQHERGHGVGRRLVQAVL